MCLNLRARWQLTQRVDLFARIINLTDTAYAERADFTGFSGDRYFPGKREICLSVHNTSGTKERAKCEANRHFNHG